MEGFGIFVVDAIVTLFAFFVAAPITLSAISTFGVQKHFARTMVEEGVIDEEEVKRMNKPKKEAPKEDSVDMPKIDYLKDLEVRMQSHLGRKVKIAGKGKKKSVTLTYEDNDDLDALLRLICGDEFIDSI